MKTILVIDDEAIMREMTAMMLESLGYACRSAESADEALAVMATTPVAAVLVDVVLPGKNGLELALELNKKWPGVPLLLMSGRVPTEADSIRNFHGHFGIKGSIAKPFTLDQLGLALEAAVGKAS